MLENAVHRLLLGKSTGDEIHNHGKAAGGPRNHLPGEAIGEAGAVEALVVGADGLAHRLQQIHKGCQRLAMDRVVLKNGLQLWRHVLRVILDGRHEPVRHGGEADVVESGAHIEHMFLLLVEVVGLRHELADARGGLGLLAEEGIECRENALAELQRAAEIGFEGLVREVDLLFTHLKFLELALELKVCCGEAIVEFLRCFFENPVGLDEIVTLHGIVQSGDHLGGNPRLGDEAENLAVVHRRGHDIQ